MVLMFTESTFRRCLRYVGLGLLTMLLCLVSRPALSSGDLSSESAGRHRVAHEQQAQDRYEAGQYHDAEVLLKTVLQDYEAAGDGVGMAVTLSNLSLTYQQLGEWSDASCRVTQAIALLSDPSNQYPIALNPLDTNSLDAIDPENIPENIPENSPEDIDSCSLKTLAQVTPIEALDKTSAASGVDVLAQALDVRGQLELSLGQLERSVETWDQAIALYRHGGNRSRAALSQIHQAQALQSMGLYPRAIDRLMELQMEVQQGLDTTSNAGVAVSTLQRLADAQRGIGRLKDARRAFRESLRLAQVLQNADVIASAYVGLGNVARAEINTTLNPDFSDVVRQSRSDVADVCLAENVAEARTEPGDKLVQAIACYQTAANTRGISLSTQTNARLNHLSLLTETRRWQRAMAVQQGIQAQIDRLSPGRATVYAQVNLVQSLIQLKQVDRTGALSWETIAAQLTQAYDQAKALQDNRAQSFALGYLGYVYELTGQTAYAERVTRDALTLAQSARAFDIAYQWQWQLGRILKTEPGQRQGAIAAYSTAFETLKQLRADLVATTPDVKFSFRKSVEPVYRELVDLLLTPISGQAISQENLVQARDVMEALQVAQLENFFQSACLDPKLKLDQVIQARQQHAAVIYPIILADPSLGEENQRLEVIVKLPNDDRLVHYPPQSLPHHEIETFLQTFRRDLQAPYTHLVVQQEGKQLYDWLVQPSRDRLDAQGVDTLIFVLDGPLRKVPMAALYDGQQYLAELYALDVVLGLDISSPEPLVRDRINVLAAGLVEPPAEFAQRYAVLKAVDTELETIQSSGIEATVIKNKDFTRSNFNATLNRQFYNVVHLATHGQFGADRDKTFLLDADGKIPLDDLASLFSTSTAADPIQLLILSACRTATGNDRDVLGIAGTAVRAGAQSAIASLWSLDDESSELFTQAFYANFGQPNVSRAEALRQAQKALMDHPTFSHPRYWAPYVLVGNWL